MVDVTLLNNKFENKSKINLSIDLSPEAINVPVVHQVVKATLASRRQGNASTKNKALVSGGGKKPFKQKGTGRARQGSSRSPLMPGGGTVFGPMPRSYEQKINKKVSLLAIQAILADKFQAGKLFVVEKLESNGKTKELAKLLASKGLSSCLVVVAADDSLALRAVKNLRTAKGVPVSGFSVYEAVKFENLIIEAEALNKLTDKLV